LKLITLPGERLQFATLNNACAERAILTASFDIALNCAQGALRLLEESVEDLPETADLTRSIHLNLVIALYRHVKYRETLLTSSTGDYPKALETCDDILKKEFCNRELEMQVAVYQCRIRFYSGDNLECVKLGLGALSLLEPGLLSMLDTPGNTAAYDSELLESIVQVSGDLGIQETFENLEVLQDKFLLAAHDLLTELIAPLAYAAPHLLHTLPLIGVLLTFKHGKCVQASFHVCLFLFSV